LGHILPEYRNDTAGRESDLASVRRDLARQHAQQRRFPCAIPAQQTDSLARLDLTRNFVQQRRAAKSNTQFA
jgi:hypothetical protein